jgi:zinc transport system substrate-binding protein
MTVPPALIHSLRRAPFALPFVLLLAAALVVGCGDDTDTDTSGDDRLTVAAAFYPLEEIARGVGGELVEVVGITPPGQGPHDLELGGRQVETIGDADVVFLIGRGFQSQVEDAAAQAGDDTTVVDLLDEVELLAVDAQLGGTQGEVDGEVLDGDVDPHVWLDPGRMIDMVDTVVAALAEVDPDHADDYRTNADEYLVDLVGLDDEYREALAECDSRVIVTSHRAFGYLAERYDLRQIPIAGISPEAEPDPRTLEAIADEARAEGVRTIFLEEIAPPDLAETVAAEIGAELSLLDPIEGLTGEQIEDGTTYAEIMRENLERLVDGLGCGA